MMQIQQLAKSFGNKQVLKNINLLLEPGKVYGIVGENGSGKTTLFRCMAGLEKYQGTISTIRPGIKNHIGLLPTDPYFFSKITGREYLRLLCQARNLPLANADEKNVFDLPLDEYALAYSTGMKKKLALTAILLQQNELFILDEPFNGVDIRSNLIITEIILSLKNMGKTIVISSHVFSTLSQTCDEIHLLKDGGFVKSVNKNEFTQLEKEMKDFVVGDSLERLGLKKAGTNPAFSSNAVKDDETPSGKQH